MGFFQSGFGKSLLGLGNAVTGGAVGAVYDAVDGIVKTVKGDKKGKGKTSGTSIDFRKTGEEATKNLMTPRNPSAMDKRLLDAMHSKAWYDKPLAWIKKNVVATAAMGGGVLFFIVRAWQMAKPKGKRWGMFK